MRKLNSKLMLIVFIAMVTTMLFMTSVKATNEGIEMITKDGEYIIYVNDYESTSFKFAFSTEKMTAEKANEELTFINSCKDANGELAAYLNDSMEVYTESKIYLYVKTMDGEAVLTAVELDLKNVLSSNDMKNIENLTTIIEVETKNTTKTEENKDGVEVTKSFGQVDITDDANCKYYYQLIALDRNKTTGAEGLMKNVQETLKTTYSSMNMGEKINVISTINEEYKTLIKNAKWIPVTNMQIVQPLTTADGDQYIVLLKKVTENDETIYDAQFLTSTRADAEKYEPEYEPRPMVSELPKTYDSAVLFIILFAIVLLVAVIYVRIKLLEKKENENK